MNTKESKTDFLNNSFEKSQALFFSKFPNKNNKMKDHFQTVIEYFLDESIEKTLSGLFIAEENERITTKSKHKIFQSVQEYMTDEEEELKKLFNSIELPELKDVKKDLCVRFKIKHTNKNFYIIRSNNRYSLFWGI
jgi:hypothetical protein